LCAAFLIHGSLGLFALYRRRHLRLPPSEAWQLALGLSIPLLLFSHAIGTYTLRSVGGIDVTFQSILYRYWIATPESSLLRQFLLLLVLWIHGCIGLRSWFRSKPWYPRAVGPLASIATLVPVLAFLGIVSAGFDLRDAVLRDTAHAARLGAAF